MLSEKEKLEEELKLLKESLELSVITKEEFENAKQRIDVKLNDLSGLEQKKGETDVREEEEIKVEQKPEEKPEPKVEKEEEKIEIKEVELKKDEEPFKEEVKEEQKKLEEVEEEPKEEVKVAEEKSTEEVEKQAEEVEKPATFAEEKKGSKKIFLYLAIIVILGFIGWYLVSSLSNPSNVVVICSSDNDCIKKGSIGICNNPGEESSECEYTKDIEVKLTVLNYKNCFNCDTGRVLSILNSFFSNIDTDNIDFETEEGIDAAEKFGITALPAYIFNSSLQQAYNYYKFFNAFDKVDSSYVMKNTVANANYYIEREEILGKLDLFVKKDQTASTKAEENLQEFLEVFDENVDFEKHDANSQIVKELGINSFPAFLINNKIKFGGVQAADKIKDNFCQMNEFDECDSELSKSLV